MGGKYSKVVNPTYPDVKLTGFTIVEIRAKMMGLAKNYSKSGVYFLNIDDIRYCFNDITEVALYRLFKQFDINGHNMKIGSLDFWGSLILTAADNVAEKVKFCLKLMDLNGSGFMSYNDLLVLLLCVSRGITCLKGYPEMPGEVAEKLIVECFRANKTNLNGAGEIELEEFASYMLADDYCITYLSSLGVKAAPVDSNALVTKRCDLMREAAAIQAQMSQIMCDLEEMSSDAEAYAKERGGDVNLLLLNPAAATHTSGGASATSASHSHSSSSSSSAALSDPRNNMGPNGNVLSKVLTQALVVDYGFEQAAQITADHPSRKYFNNISPFVDAEVFSDARAGRPVGAARNIYGENFKKGLFTVWQKLPHTDDNMVHLDEFTLIKLFDNVGITLSYPDARRCLKDIGPSAVEKYAFNDVVHWYRMYSATLVDAPTAPPPSPAAAAAAAGVGQKGGSLDKKVARGTAVAKKGKSSVAAIAAAATAAEQAQLPGGGGGGGMKPLPQQSGKGGAVAGGSGSNNGPVNVTWRQFQTYMGSHYSALCKWYLLSLEDMATQRRILDGIDRVPATQLNKYKVPFMQHLRAKLAVNPENGGGALGNPNALSFTSKAASGSAADSTSLLNKLLAFRSTSAKKQASVALKYVFGDANDIHAECLPKQLNTDENDAEAAAAAAADQTEDEIRASSRAGEARTMSPIRRLKSREKKRPQMKYAKKINVEEITDFDMKIKLNISSNPYTNITTKRSKEACRLKTTEELGNIIHDFVNLQCADILDYFNMKEEEEAQAAAVMSSDVESPNANPEQQTGADNGGAVNNEIASAAFAAASTTTTAPNKGAPPKAGAPPPTVTKKPKEFNSVAWLCFHLLPGSTEEQEQVLCRALLNFFRAIPAHLRKHLYTDVSCEMFTVLPADAGKDLNSVMAKMVAAIVQAAGGRGGGEGDFEDGNPTPERDRVAVLALLHETDHLQVLEKELISSDLFVSRAINSATIELSTTKTFSQLMERSQLFHHYETLLFGPQEGELGDEGMNPLKFAKDVRQRKKEATKMAETVPKMTRDALMGLCKELGVRDSGLGRDMVQRLVPLFEEQAEQAGRGELSEFASDLITTIYNIFRHPENDEEIEKKDAAKNRRDEAAAAGVNAATQQKDEKGLKLWELNALLHKTGTGTIYDAKEYKLLMAEHQLLVDKEEKLLLNGFKAYYRSNGRLAGDNNAVGVGSLNDMLAGKMSFTSHFEPDSLGSFLNLVGNNPLFVPEIIKKMMFLSTLKDIKVDSRVENFGDIFEAFATKFGMKLSKEVFNSPGWLSRFVSEFSEFLADGPGGIIPSLRSMVLKRYGQYDQWEDTYLQKVPDAVDFEWEGYLEMKNRHRVATAAAMEAERLKDLAAVAESAKLEAEKALAAMAEDDPEVDLSLFKTDDFTAAASLDGNTTSGGGGGGPDVMFVNHMDDEEYEETPEEKKETEAARSRIIKKCVVNILPSVINSIEVDLQAKLNEIKEDMIFLSEIQSNPTTSLPVDIGITVAKRREKLLADITVISEQLKEQEVNLQAHTCALYDAVRLFSRSISNFGIGTRDVSMRGCTIGCDWIPYVFPRAMGERSVIKQKLTEKINRANKRRVAALAALEREKLRRNMTEEEKEQLRLEKQAAERKRWAIEEAQMLAEALDATFAARAERKTSVEIAEMVAKWEALLAIKEERYPNHYRVAVVMNDLACIMLEFYGLEHPMATSAGPLLQSAAEILMKDVVVPDEPLPPMPKHLGRPTTAGSSGFGSEPVNDNDGGLQELEDEEHRIRHKVRENMAYHVHITKIVATGIELPIMVSSAGSETANSDGNSTKKSSSGIFFQMRSGTGDNISWTAHTNVVPLDPGDDRSNKDGAANNNSINISSNNNNNNSSISNDSSSIVAKPAGSIPNKTAGFRATWNFSSTNGPHIIVSDLEMDTGELQCTCLSEDTVKMKKKDAVVGVGDGVYPIDMLHRIRLGEKQVTAVVKMDLRRDNRIVGQVSFSLLYATEYDMSKKKLRRELSSASVTSSGGNLEEQAGNSAYNTIHNFYVLKMIAKNFSSREAAVKANSVYSLFLQCGAKKYIRWSCASRFEPDSQGGKRVVWDYSADDPSIMNMLATQEELKDSGRIKCVLVNGGVPEAGKDISWADHSTVVGSGEIKFPSSLLEDALSTAAEKKMEEKDGDGGSSGGVHQVVIPMQNAKGQVADVYLYLSKDKYTTVPDSVDSETNRAYHLHITKITTAIKLVNMTNRKGGLYFLLKSGMDNLVTWTSITSVQKPEEGLAEWNFTPTGGPHIIVTDAEMESGIFHMKCLEETQKVKDPCIGKVDGAYPKEFLETIRSGAQRATAKLEVKLLDNLGYGVGVATVEMLYAENIDLPKTPDTGQSLSRKALTMDFLTSTVYTFSVISIFARNLKNYKTGSFSLFLESGTKTYTRWARATKFQSKGKDGLVNWHFAEQSDMNLIVAEEEFYNGGSLRVMCVDAEEDEDEAGNLSWSGTPTVVGSGSSRYQQSMLELIDGHGQRAKTPTAAERAASPSGSAKTVISNASAVAFGGGNLSSKDEASTTRRKSLKSSGVIPLTIILKDAEGEVTGEVVINLMPVQVKAEEVQPVKAQGKTSGRFNSFKSPAQFSTKKGAKSVEVAVVEEPPLISEEDEALLVLLKHFSDEDENRNMQNHSAASSRRGGGGESSATSEDGTGTDVDSAAQQLTNPLSKEQQLSAGPTIAMLVNYIAVLTETESVSQLRKSYEVKKYCYYLFKRMTATQRDKMARMVVSKFFETPTFCYTNSFKKFLAGVLNEVYTLNDRLYQKRLAEEMAKWKEAEEEEVARVKAESMRNAKPLSKKELRELEKEKHKNQRQLDNAKRAELSQQRNMLYKLIQSNQISDIFAARSAGVAGAGSEGAQPKWGSEERAQLAEAEAALKSFSKKIG